MTKMKKQRKGFTLTELAIVIAVIAILIAVLVPTFTSLISKANESADEQAVKSMNTSLAAAEAIDGKPDSAADAMAVLEADGFNVKNYVALDSGNTIYYDLTYNRCLIWSSTDSKVTYPSDMVSAYSKIDGIAANWYTFETIYNIENQTTTIDSSNVSSANSVIATAISSAGKGETVVIELEEDLNTTIELSSTLTNSKGSYVTIDLNGNNINYTYNSGSVLNNNSTLYFKDGEVTTTYEGYYGNYRTYAFMQVESGSSLTLENVTLTTEATAIYPRGDAAQVNIIDSTIISNGVYGVSTNAETPSNYGVSINIENSTITSHGVTDYDNVAVMINTPGTLTITDSVLTGDRQGLIVRAGTAVVTNTTITCTGKYSGTSYYTATDNKGNWGSGTEVPMGALIIGNRKGTYAGDATITCYNVTATYQGNSENGFDVYMYGGVDCNIVNGERVENTGVKNKAILNYDSACNLGTITRGETDYTEVNPI